MTGVTVPAVLTFLGALATAFVLTPAVAALAARLGLLDRPGGRKLHDRAVPRVGGVAVFLGLLTGTFAFGLFFGWERLGRAISGEPLLLLAPCCFVFAVGVVDDVRGLGPTARVVAEVLAAGMLVQAGFVIDVVANPFGPAIRLGILAVPVTLLWFVGLANAFNLVDGLDGLMSALGLVALASCAAVGFLRGMEGTAVFALALAGGLAGFLPHNWHPARTFIGDAGSLLVGFVVAALTLKVARMPNGTLYFHVPLAIAAVPIGETALTLARRYVNGQGFFSGDQSHIHHVLRKSGRSVPGVVLRLAGVAALLAAVAVFSLSWRSTGSFLTIAALLAAAWFSLRRLGYLELRVFRDRLKDLFLRPRRKGLPDLLAVARAGECVRGAAGLADLRDRLRAAVVEGRFAYLAVEFRAEAAAALGVDGPIAECRNTEARAYALSRNGGTHWIFSTEACGYPVDHARLVQSAVAFPLPADGTWGRLVCARYLPGDAPAPPSQDVRRYLADPVAEALEAIAAVAAAAPSGNGREGERPEAVSPVWPENDWRGGRPQTVAEA